jgi:hypothetical protein
MFMFLEWRNRRSDRDFLYSEIGWRKKSQKMELWSDSRYIAQRYRKLWVVFTECWIYLTSPRKIRDKLPKCAPIALSTLYRIVCLLSKCRGFRLGIKIPIVLFEWILIVVNRYLRGTTYQFFPIAHEMTNHSI